MNLLSTQEIDTLSIKEIIEAELFAQITSCSERLTKTGKPYLEIVLSDAKGSIPLKVWNDKTWFDEFLSWGEKSTISVKGSWLKGTYGMEASNLSLRALTEEEQELLFAGGATTELQEKAWADVLHSISEIQDPRLHRLCELVLEKFEARLRRAAAARTYHHARRGGLIEHIAGMFRCARAISGVYPELNKDLLYTGVLFHDIGKLWETCYGEHDFSLPYSEAGELLGHIPLGIEMANRLWQIVMSENSSDKQAQLSPPANDVRLHVLHMIAAHHGEIEFGSPVVPKTPEAMALHYIDNLDAKMEMFSSTYQKSDMLSTRIYRRNPPLPSSIFTPLEHYSPETPENESMTN